jgi:hypothetical protein
VAFQERWRVCLTKCEAVLVADLVWSLMHMVERDVEITHSHPPHPFYYSPVFLTSAQAAFVVELFMNTCGLTFIRDIDQYEELNLKKYQQVHCHSGDTEEVAPSPSEEEKAKEDS